MGQQGARVLIVEDNADAAESLSMLLELFGHTAQVAPDGAAALARTAQEVFDVVLVDIGLPGMDGYEVARQLRASGRPVGMLVALTGYGRQEDLQAAAGAGFDRHVMKPADPDAIQALVQEALARPH